MTTDFDITSATYIPYEYSWDSGTPYPLSAYNTTIPVYENNYGPSLTTEPQTLVVSTSGVLYNPSYLQNLTTIIDITTGIVYLSGFTPHSTIYNVSSVDTSSVIYDLLGSYNIAVSGIDFATNTLYLSGFTVYNQITSVSAIGVTQTLYVSGYAPYLSLSAINLSDLGTIPASGARVDYTWNFGDYYNIGSNIIISPLSSGSVSHVYIMPGIYEISLQQTYTVSSLVKEADLCNGKCLEKYCENWYWDNLHSDIRAITWDQTDTGQIFEKTWDYQPITSSDACFDNCVPPCYETHCQSWNWRNTESSSVSTVTWGNAELGGSKEKVWAYTPVEETEECFSTLLLPCFQKYCKPWTWYYLACDHKYATTWAEVKSGTTTPKIWGYEPLSESDPCNVSNSTVVTNTTAVTLVKGVVQVFEIPPISYIRIPSVVLSGASPFLVHLSADAVISGSFPVDRIDWDFFGDGNIYTVSKYGSPDSSKFTFINAFSADVADPRNYQANIVYTDTGVFYPSITAYSSSTGSFDACSAHVGPIKNTEYDTSGNTFRVVKAGKGMIATEINNSLHLYSTSIPADLSANNIVQRTPNNPMRSIL